MKVIRHSYLHSVSLGRPQVLIKVSLLSHLQLKMLTIQNNLLGFPTDLSRTLSTTEASYQNAYIVAAVISVIFLCK